MNESILGSSHPKFVYNYGVANQTFTVSSVTDRLTITPHGLYEGQRVKVSSSTTLPAPLAANTIYYVKLVDANNFQLAETIGGSAIDITDTGTGTHSLITEMEIDLEYWLTINDDVDVRSVFQESELIADRQILDRGEYFEFYGRLNLYKYGLEYLEGIESESSESEAPVEQMDVIRAKMLEIYHYRKKEVTLFKHKDGHPYRDSNGNEVMFYVESVVLKNLTTLDYRDVMFIRFLSLTEVDFGQLTSGLVLITETGESIQDESGNDILTF